MEEQKLADPVKTDVAPEAKEVKLNEHQLLEMKQSVQDKAVATVFQAFVTTLNAVYGEGWSDYQVTIAREALHKLDKRLKKWQRKN